MKQKDVATLFFWSIYAFLVSVEVFFSVSGLPTSDVVFICSLMTVGVFGVFVPEIMRGRRWG